MTGAGYEPPVDPDGASNPEARNWGTFVHLAALAGFIIPFGNLIGPLIIWFVQRDRWPYVDRHGREAVNFQLTVTAVQLILACAGVGSLVGAIFVISSAEGSGQGDFAPFAIFGILGFYALIAFNLLVGMASWILAIVGGVKASSGQHFRYPIAFRLL